MKIDVTKNSLDLVQDISKKIDDLTFHHHYHILFDIANQFFGNFPVSYLEIGCYGGASSCLMLSKENTKVVSVDLGNPISKEKAESNVLKVIGSLERFKYIQGNSQLDATFENVKLECSEYDIIFIDGDHSYSGVMKDFESYSRLLKKGGFIVFDDYNCPSSVEVKPAVDFISNTKKDEYEIFGCIPNLFGARPSMLVEGNEYVLRKI